MFPRARILLYASEASLRRLSILGCLRMAITHGGDIFAIAREHGWDWRDVADFSANINPLGPAPGVRPRSARQPIASCITRSASPRNLRKAAGANLEASTRIRFCSAMARRN